MSAVRSTVRTVAAGGAVAVLVAAVAGLGVGDVTLTPAQLWAAVTGPPDTPAWIVLGTIRLPRVLLAVVAGAALGVSGALIQSLTRNPIADPGVLGVNAGAALAVVAAGALLDLTSVVSTLPAALLGALATTLAVYVVAAAGGASSDPARLLLSGVAFSALFGGVVTTATQLDPDLFSRFASWGAGSLSGRGWEPLLVGTPVVLVGLLAAGIAGPALNQLGLGDGLSRATGAPVTRVRLLTVVAVALLAGGATAMVGPVAFAGLIVPHVARRWAGPDQTRLIGLCAVLGPLLLLVADLLARTALPRGELPVGVVTGIVGAPVLILALRRQRVSRT